MVAIAAGLWWDYSKPAVQAATLTLPVDSGNLLLSALAVLVAVAGASFWNITAFILHSLKAQEGPVNALSLQHQVSLRNSPGSIGTAWEAVKIHHAWSKKRPPRLLTQTCTVAIPAFIIWVGFAAAAIFTSRVANKANGSVLARVKPENCGFWQYDDSRIDGEVAFRVKQSNDTIQARTYVSNFYANTSSSSTARSIFVRPTLPYTTSASAPCPIPAAERCILGSNAAFSMKTLLDSHEMLGINAKSEDRVSVEISVTCSQVITKGLHSANSTHIMFYLGQTGGGFRNYTYLYDLATAATGVGYLLVPTVSFAQGPPRIWDPIPDFNRTDADVSVYFLSQNGIGYLSPVYDRWFSANGTYTTDITGKTLIIPDSYVNTMVCADQYVLCNPSTSFCTPASGWYRLRESALTENAPGFNLAQLATAGRIIIALTNSNTYSSVEGPGAEALWANNMAIGNISPSLPDNQWQIEVLGWFQTSLAKLQAYMVDFASNTAGLGPFGTVQSPYGNRTDLDSLFTTDRVLRRQCENQLVQTAGDVKNFSFLGVMIIVFACLSLVLLDCSLERIVNFANQYLGSGYIAKRARQADNKMHLLRMALSSPDKNGNAWECRTWDVPVLDGDMRFDRPAITEGLVSYGNKVEMAENGANGDESSQVLDK